jgi:hypothetical protein
VHLKSNDWLLAEAARDFNMLTPGLAKLLDGLRKAMA